DRAGADDAAMPVADHDLRRLARQHEGRGEVGGDDRLEVRGRIVERGPADVAAGIRYEDVEPAMLACDACDRVDRRLLVADVEGKRAGGDTVLAQHLGRRAELFGVAG